jgi:hypothetical protein
MSNELTPQGDDGFSVPENSKGQFIRGQMTKFNDSVYIVDKTEPLPDEPLIAVGAITAWVHWGKDKNGNSKPIEHRVTAAGQIHPDRDDLPDQDESLWPLGLDGKPADPWKDTRYLNLINPWTGADYTFVTDSYGGRKGVGILKSKITNVRMAHPRAVPVVKCTTAPFKTQYGMRKRPEFEVIGWRNTDSTPTIMPNEPRAIEQVKAKASAEEPPPVTSDAEFQDEISW